MNKGALIFLSVLLVVGGIVYAQFADVRHDATYSIGVSSRDWLGFYDTVTGDSSAFEIGINKYGMPVFIDRDKAFKELKNVSAQGIAEMKKRQPDLPSFRKGTMNAYANRCWQMDWDGASEEVRLQAALVGGFYDIYENSDWQNYEGPEYQ